MNIEDPLSVKQGGQTDYKAYTKERFELQDKNVERIESIDIKNLPDNYKKQYEALNDQRLENVKVLIVPDDLWGKSGPSESAAQHQFVSFKESYFKATEKPDEAGWMLHELAHCKRFLDSETPEAYQKDNQTFAFNDIKSEYPYPNNKVEEYVFSHQFQYLKNQGKTKQEIAEILKEHYNEDDFLFFNRILDEIYKEEGQKNNIDKQIIWENKQKEIESWGDKQGLGIDEKIKEAVVAFNMVGLPTGESCEGHLDWGYSAPWVGVEAPDQPAERFIGQDKIFQKYANEYNLSLEEIKRGKNNEAYFKALGEAAENGETPEFEEWRQKNQELLKKANELLGEFYKDRKVPENIKLQIDEGAEGAFRVYNGGEDYRPITGEKFKKLTDEQKKDLAQRLGQYQEEMKKFTEFLKDKYFEMS